MPALQEPLSLVWSWGVECYTEISKLANRPLNNKPWEGGLAPTIVSSLWSKRYITSLFPHVQAQVSNLRQQKNPTHLQLHTIKILKPSQIVLLKQIFPKRVVN